MRGMPEGKQPSLTPSMQPMRTQSPGLVIRTEADDNSFATSTLEQDGKITSKWNMHLAESLASKKAKLQKMNHGASFLVSPHNMTFNKHAINSN